MADLKYYLRKHEFPKVVFEALLQLNKQISYDTTNNLLIKEIIDEFVFFEVDKKGNRKAKLSSIQELQVLNHINTFFNGAVNDSKLLLFMHLFPTSNPKLLDKRMKIINSLVSMGSALGNGIILTYVGILIQMMGPKNELSLKINQAFYEEQFTGLTSKQTVLNLATISPIFCASFIMSLCSLYATRLPDKEAITVILEWIKINSNIICATHTIALPPVLQCRFSPQSLLPGLLTWTILLSFTCNNEEDQEACNKLHLTLLQSMLNMKIGQLELISFLNIFNLVEQIKELPIDSRMPAFDRLGQVLQIGISSRCITPNKESLKSLIVTIRQFGYNRLLEIIYSKWDIT